mmetsp:Transcript_3856/g.10287  ORF Transcript_3856/g.10287 Transcript_3856/m.10287 type:complete len:204 (+) Transcript_3856:562-1173(+)
MDADEPHRGKDHEAEHRQHDHGEPDPPLIAGSHVAREDVREHHAAAPDQEHEVEPAPHTSPSRGCEQLRHLPLQAGGGGLDAAKDDRLDDEPGDHAKDQHAPLEDVCQHHGPKAAHRLEGGQQQEEEEPERPLRQRSVREGGHVRAEGDELGEEVDRGRDQERDRGQPVQDRALHVAALAREDWAGDEAVAHHVQDRDVSPPL